MPSPLVDLPAEILNHIVAHLDGVGALARLSQTCRALYDYADRDGYRCFIRANFPSYRPPAYWKDAARSLTGLTRAWETRSFIARVTEPPSHAKASGKAYAMLRSHRQTMGYPAVVVCREDWTGSDWRSRDEMLAIGAGAELRVRTSSMGPEVDRMWEAASPGERTRDYDSFKHRHQWQLYRDARHMDGKCDITSINFLPKSDPSQAQEIIHGRACGAVEQITLADELTRRRKFKTNDGAVRFSDLSPAKEPLLVVGQVNSLALFRNSQDEAQLLDPSAELQFESQGRGSRVWAGRFLDHNRLVIGRDSKVSPLALHHVRPESIETSPSWSTNTTPPSTCANVICPVVSSRNSDYSTNIFLSAWKSGTAYLHDLRSEQSHVASFTDPIDVSTSFYSLLPFGMERFLAGSNKHGAIKVFDLRMSGARAYSAIHVPHCLRSDTRAQNQPIQVSSSSNLHGLIRFQRPPVYPRYDFSLFLQYSRKQSRRPNRLGRSMPELNFRNSSVYHLTSASPFAPTFYAGLEGATAQIDIVSAIDKFQDVSFGEGILEKRPEEISEASIENWLDPLKEQVLLGLVESAQPNMLGFQMTLDGLVPREKEAFAPLWWWDNGAENADVQGTMTHRSGWIRP